MQSLSDPPIRDPARPRRRHHINRRDWVLEALRAGKTQAEIATALRITRERVRQIAKEALDGLRVEPLREHNHLQIARLRPALRTAGDAVVLGEVNAIYPLLKILDKLDAYQASSSRFYVPNEDEELSAGVKMFLDKIQMIKEHYNRLGLVEQVQTLAQAYALSELEREQREAQEKAAGVKAAEPGSPPPKGEKPNFECVSD